MAEYISILKESLEKKIAVLEQLYVKNQEQEIILRNPNATPEEFEENVEQKGRLIDQIERLDEGFENLYNRVKKELNKNRDKYASEVEIMKGYITKITDLSVQLQTQEQDNKKLAQIKFSTIKQQVKEVKQSQKAVNSYYQNMMKVNLVDPQFMDSKK